MIQELSQGQRRAGLWAKAIAQSNGVDEKIEGLYIRYRVQSIKDEIEITEALTKEIEKQTKTIYIQESTIPSQNQIPKVKQLTADREVDENKTKDPKNYKNDLGFGRLQNDFSEELRKIERRILSKMQKNIYK